MPAADRESPARRGPPRKLLIVQYLRGIAAMMVVFHHARDPRPWLFSPIGGFTGSGAGVEIFFVISGIVIYLAARDEPALEFARRRVIRVVPLYWLATTLTLAMLLRHKPALGPVALDYLRSLLFIPYAAPGHPEVIFPMLIPGWTLNYEMFFYALFLLGILLGRVIATISVAVLALVALGLLPHPPNALIATYSSPLMLDFLAGLWLAHALGSRWLPRLALLLPLGFAALLLGDLLGDVPRFVRAGLPSMAVAAGALAIELRHKIPPLALPTLIGDASYSIYLSHLFTLMVVERVARDLPLGGWAQFAVWMAMALVAAAAVGVAVHLWIEKPLLRCLNRLTRPDPHAKVAAAEGLS